MFVFCFGLTRFQTSQDFNSVHFKQVLAGTLIYNNWCLVIFLSYYFQLLVPVLAGRYKFVHVIGQGQSAILVAAQVIISRVNFSVVPVIVKYIIITDE